MSASLDDLGGDVLFRADEAVGAEIGDAALGVDGGHVVGRGVGGDSASVGTGGVGAASCEEDGGGAAGVGLFREVEV